MPKISVIRVLRKWFITDDLDEDLIPIDKQSWLYRLDSFRKKLGLKKSKKKINGKDIVFNWLVELLSDHDAGVDFKTLEQYWSNQDIEFYIPQLCHYIVKDGRYSDIVEKFLLLRASRSVSFAHQVLWNFLSGLDEGREEMSMKTVDFLQNLTNQGRKAISTVQNAHLYLNSDKTQTVDEKYMAYRGTSSLKDNLLPELGLLSKLNYDGHANLFFSTPIFISNLLSISEYLRTQQFDKRPDILKSMITKLNEELPNNVYIPIGNFNGHRVLRIRLEHSIWLHSNEKAPFHILIETENISYENIQNTLLLEAEECKYATETYRTSSIGSQDSIEDDENASLRLSNESTPRDSNDSNDEAEDNHVFQFVDHYAENLVDKDSDLQLLELRQITPKQFEEDKYNSDGQTSISTNDSIRQAIPRNSDNFQYQLARVSKRKTNFWKKVFLWQCEDEEEVVPIANGDPSNYKKLGKEKLNRINPIGLFGRQKFSEVKEEMKAQSDNGHLENWDLISVIVKSGENIQQEKFAACLMEKFQDIFRDAKVKCWLRPFTIVATSPVGGIVETITDAISIDRLKKSYPEIESLRTYYLKTFGGTVKSKAFKKARKAFVRSLAGYSLLCYILQIKDRHNANILIDSEGHMVHVDFGFMLSNSPGSMNFEASSFKLTAEFVDVMGGQRSQALRLFKNLMIKGFMALRKNSEKIISYIEMTMMSNPKMSWFQRGAVILDELRDRFKLDLPAADCKKFMNDLIEKSTDNWRTRWYDKYQRFCVGVW